MSVAVTRPAPRGLQLDEASGRWVIAAAVLGSGIASMDATVVNLALPAIGRDLHADFAGLQWTINAYTLTLAAFILIGGSLGDRFGRRRIFVLGTLWFAGGSALCALAPSIEVLVGARALQGIGGALLTPGSLAIIAASFSERDRSRAIGAWSGLGGIAGAGGPFIGGFLLSGPGWRWIFLINLPLAALVIAIAQRHLDESRDPEAAPHLDLVGAVLGVVGLGGLTYALTSAGGGWSPGAVVGTVLGAAAVAAFIVNERRSNYPMLPPDIFANRQFSAANLVTFVVYAALGGVFFFLVVDLQVVAGFSPLVAGTALLPITLIMLVLSERSGDLASRIGPRLQMSLGPIVAACGALLLLRVGPGASYVADVLPGVIVFALGLSLIVAPLTSTVLAAAEARHAGIASGINNAVARTAGLVAVAALPLLAGLSGADYENAATFAGGFRVAVTTCAALLALGGLIAAVTIRNPTRIHVAPPPARRVYCAIDGPPIQQPS